MKHIITKSTLIIGLVLAASCAFGQIRIDWQQSYGTSVNEYAYNIFETENGLMTFGFVYTDPYDGLYDCGHYVSYGADWLFEINNEHSIINQNCYTKGLYPKLCKANTDKCYIATISFNIHNIWNLWITRIDDGGNPIWYRELGTTEGLANSASDVFSIGTLDGGVVVAVLCNEASGDITHHYGGTDCWLVKLDSLGNMVWETTLGTQSNENVTCLQNASDGGFYVGLKSGQSGNGNIGCGQPENNCILVKMNASGQQERNLCFPQFDICSIVELDEGFLLAGHYSFHVEPGGNCGDGIHTSDCCLLRCDSEGTIIWKKNYGGSCIDKTVKVFGSEEKGYTVFSNSRSLDGDVASASQLSVTDVDAGNIWVFHVDFDGDLVWERCIGSELGLLESVKDVINQGDGEYAIVGECTWFDEVSSGDVNCSNNLILPNSGTNIWILHITDIFDYDAVPESSDGEVAIHPNPTNSIVRITGAEATEVQVFNSLGQCVKTLQSTNEVSLEGLPQGVYLLRVTTADGKVFSDKVVKE